MNLTTELLYKNSSPSYFEWILMATWSTIIVITSTTGNIIVLLATIKYNAIKLDDISVVLIRNIAIADLGVALYIASTLPGIITKHNLYSDLFCIFSKTWFYACLSAEVILLAALSISKLMWILRPLQSLSRSKKNGRIIASLIWLLMICLTAGTTLYRESTKENWTEFHSAVYQCSRENYDKNSNIMFNVIVMVFNIVPQLVITVATVWLLCLVSKAGVVHKQGLITILLVCALFFLSHAPYGFIYQILKKFLDGSSSSWFSVLYRWSYYIVYLNYAANPFIYFASIDSFNRFVKQRLLKTEALSLSERSTSQSFAVHRVGSLQSRETLSSRRETYSQRMASINLNSVQV